MNSVNVGYGLVAMWCVFWLFGIESDASNLLTRLFVWFWDTPQVASLVTTFLGVLMAFYFDERIKKRRWLKKYTRVW